MISTTRKIQGVSQKTWKLSCFIIGKVFKLKMVQIILVRFKKFMDFLHFSGHFYSSPYLYLIKKPNQIQMKIHRIFSWWRWCLQSNCLGKDWSTAHSWMFNTCVWNIFFVLVFYLMYFDQKNFRCKFLLAENFTIQTMCYSKATF